MSASSTSKRSPLALTARALPSWKAATMSCQRAVACLASTCLPTSTRSYLHLPGSPERTAVCASMQCMPASAQLLAWMGARH